MLRIVYIFLVLVIISPVTFAEQVQLIRDRHFQSGFNVLSPKHGKRVVEGKLDWDENDEPLWDIGQWHSKFSINGAKLQRLSPDKYVYGNIAKKITVGKIGSKFSDITLAINSKAEYKGKYRKANEPWPHLLVSQSVAKRCPDFSKIKQLNYHLEARLIKDETIKGQGYDSHLHCAQIPCVLTIQNLNKKSAGYGDFIWFQIPIYDDRYEFSPLLVVQDSADPSQRMIYSPGAKVYMSQSLKSHKWVMIDKDIYPLIIDALNTAWKKGYLLGSRDLSDYKVGDLILGWEVTGLNKVSMQFRNYSLIAVVSDDK